MYCSSEVSLYSLYEVYCAILTCCRIEHLWTFPRVFAPTSSNISHLAPLSIDEFWCQFLWLQKRSRSSDRHCLTIIRRIFTVQEKTNVIHSKAINNWTYWHKDCFTNINMDFFFRCSWTKPRKHWRFSIKNQNGRKWERSKMKTKTTHY